MGTPQLVDQFHWLVLSTMDMLRPILLALGRRPAATHCTPDPNTAHGASAHSVALHSRPVHNGKSSYPHSPPKQLESHNCSLAFAQTR
jgi:hypothetical protein